MTEQVITFEAMEQAANLFGSFDENIKLLEREYGVTITGAVRSGKVYGTQFHPEKSGEVGLKMLEAFMEV